MPETQLRRATLADHGTVLAFHRALYVEYRGTLTPAHLEELYAYQDMGGVLRDDVDALLRNPRAAVWLAVREQAAVGYISGHVEVDDRRVLARKGVIEDWYVAADARGTGAGRQLFQALVEHFRSQGCQLIESGTWPTNLQARAIHRALGFEETYVQLRMRL